MKPAWKIILWLVGIVIWICLSTILACIPALPFWYFGYVLTGSLFYVFLGLPIGLAAAFVIVTAVIGSFKRDSGDDNDSDDDKKDNPPPPIHNRIAKFYKN